MTDEEKAHRAYRLAMKTGGRGKRSPKLEPLILTSAHWSARYTFYCVGKRWKKAEAIIAKEARAATDYAVNMGCLFPEAEKTIARHSECAYLYAKRVLKGRFPLAERAISKDPKLASQYAADIVKGRWVKGEAAIMEETKWMLHYATKAIKGQLPEAMHNKMVMSSMMGDPYAKKYGSTKKFMTPPAPKKAKKGKG